MPPIRNQSFHGTSTRQHNGGTSCSNGYASFNGASFNSRESYESFNDSARDQLDREEEDAAIDRAVRLYELEAAKSRYLNEEDLRAFATSVFRRAYRSQRNHRVPDTGATMSRVREERSISELTDDNIEETSPARTPEHKFRYKKNGKGTSHFSGDVMSLPYNTQRKLIKAMYKLCFESAFYFTKRYTLPLTLNVESPFSPVTRLTIQDLTDAILDAYNKSTIPNTAVEEDVGFGFAAVFTAAIALDDALMYFDKSLSDRRIRSILLTGVDLVNVLKDEQAIDAAESIIAETEEKIEHVRRKSWEGESVAASMAASMADTDVDMSGDEKDDEVEDEDTMGDVPTPTSTSATEETRTSNRTVTENGNGGAASNDSSNTV